MSTVNYEIIGSIVISILIFLLFFCVLMPNCPIARWFLRACLIVRESVRNSKHFSFFYFLFSNGSTEWNNSVFLMTLWHFTFMLSQNTRYKLIKILRWHTNRIVFVAGIYVKWSKYYLTFLSKRLMINCKRTELYQIMVVWITINSSCQNGNRL